MMVQPGRYSAKLTVDGRSYTQPVIIVPDPRVHVSAAALAAQFKLEQRMVAGLTVSYEGFNYIERLHDALARVEQTPGTSAAAAQIIAGAKALDTAAQALAVRGFGIVHRDLGRRYSDQFIADAMPTPSIIAGADAPCRQLDATLTELRRLEAGQMKDLNGILTRSGLSTLPSWTPPPAPSCGRF